ncbi:unnamed protein product, partial [marine sediment metagenome]
KNIFTAHTEEGKQVSVSLDRFASVAERGKGKPYYK